MSSGGTTGSGGTSGGSITGSGGTTNGGSTGSGGSTTSGGTTGLGGTPSSGTTGLGGTSSGGATGGGAEGTPGSGGSGGRTGVSAGGANGFGGRGGSGGADGGPARGGATGDGGGGTGSGSFALTSPDQAEAAHFDAKFTCASTAGTVGQLGNGVNPELDWSGAPAGTMSFAMTFIDTTLGDTNPMGQHWAIWNIPATVTKFPQATATLTGDLATAKQSGKFLAPCAQSLMNNMDDQYEFTIYALSTATLNITGTTVANALTALKATSPLGAAKLHGHAGLKGQ